MIKEDRMLLSFLADKARQCENRGMISSTGFLDLRQQAIARQWCAQNGVQRFALYGGYDEAERRLCAFFPDYVPWDGASPELSWFADNPQDEPLTLLRASHSGRIELSHGDYLGSLLGLGIKRAPIGDILVRPDGCDIVVEQAMGRFLHENYSQAGRTPLQVQLHPVGDIDISQIRFEEFTDTVASLRLDNLIAAGFRAPRSRAADAIRAGLVFADGAAAEKPDAAVGKGCRLVWRGKGKVLLSQVGQTTKKGRIFVRFRRYL